MTTFTQRAAGRLASLIEAASAVSIKYRTESGDCELLAVPGRTASEEYGDDLVATARRADWIVDPMRLRIDGEQVWPRGGDVIATSDGRTFEVGHSDSEDVWRWVDQFEQRIRIHTVEVPAEPGME